MKMSGITSEGHFDSIAENYDEHKEISWYYYKTLKRILLENLKDVGSKSILEIGCGTGDLISNLNPKYGFGVDISKNMVNIAKKKHKKNNLKFKVSSAEKLNIKEKFDIIIMLDVVEHLNDLDETVKRIRGCMHKDSILLITTASPLWKPFMEIGEKLKLKMEEGPHRWTWKKEIKSVLKSNNLNIIKMENTLIFPVYVPFISKIVNGYFGKFPLIKNLGLIQILVAKI